jgi:hypothetical protein
MRKNVMKGENLSKKGLVILIRDKCFSDDTMTMNPYGTDKNIRKENN